MLREMYTERIDSHAVEVLLGIYMYTILTRFMKFFSIRSTTVLGTMEETHESVCKSYVRTYKNCTLFTQLDATLVLLLNKNPGFCWVRSFDKFDAWSYTNSVASSWDSKDDFLSENEGDLLSSAEENLTKKTLKKVGIFENIIFLFFRFWHSYILNRVFMRKHLLSCLKQLMFQMSKSSLMELLNHHFG